MAKRKRFEPRYSFQRDGNSTVSAAMYASMLHSKAYTDLRPSARILYVYMALQLYGQPAVDGNETVFYFNRDLWMNKYKLYTKWEQFNRDRDLLISHGFIEVIESGKNTRTKNKYKFSDKWKLWE